MVENPTTTLAIVPNERWSLSVRSLRGVLEQAPQGVELVYVDGGAPEPIETELRAIVSRHDGRYVRRDHIVTPSEARNLALDVSSGEFIVFADNDVIPEPGWFEALVTCAVETGAGAVCPLVTHGVEAGSNTIHHANGEFTIVDGQVLANAHGHYDESVDEVGALVREPTQQIEFHSMLVRRSMLEEIGPFDENIWSMGDHEHLALAAAGAGWDIWFEPASVVTYLQFVPLDDIDRGYWQLRWSEAWNQQSIDYLARRWELDRSVGWLQQIGWWSSQRRMEWWPERSPVTRWAGRGFRRLAGGPSARAALVRRTEERFFCRAGRAELERRELNRA